VRGRNDLDLLTLEDKNLTELRDIAKDLNVTATATMKKSDLVLRILEAQAAMSGNAFKRGILEFCPTARASCAPKVTCRATKTCMYRRARFKRFNLRTGDVVFGSGACAQGNGALLQPAARRSDKWRATGHLAPAQRVREADADLPTEKFNLETSQDNITARIIDLVSPIGKGQRGLIVAPPKAGKTSLIKNVANSIALNHPEVVLIVL
jgi:transcription termination factor Rho